MWGTQKTLQQEKSKRVDGGAKIDVNLLCWTFGDSRYGSRNCQLFLSFLYWYYL